MPGLRVVFQSRQILELFEGLTDLKWGYRGLYIGLNTAKSSFESVTGR